MALTTYTELKAAVADWLNRSDLTTPIVDFITLAEQDIERELRAAVTKAAISLDSGSVSLPATAGEVRYLRHNSTLYKGNIDIVTPAILADYRVAWASATGTPRWAAIVAGKIELVPAPDATYTAEIVYYDALIPLSGSVASNSVLVAAPDAYLYGALYHASVYLQHDERAGLFQDKFNQAIFGENKKREQAELGGAPQQMRLPVVFGDSV
jgi:hypothetical protein